MTPQVSPAFCVSRFLSLAREDLECWVTKPMFSPRWSEFNYEVFWSPHEALTVKRRTPRHVQGPQSPESVWGPRGGRASYLWCQLMARCS